MKLWLTSSYPRDYLDLIPISLLAFEAAGQVCLSRVLSFADLPTIVISTLYHDHVADSLYFQQDLKLAREGKNQACWEGTDNVSNEEKKPPGCVQRLMLVSGGRQKRQVYRVVCILCLLAGATTGANVRRLGAAPALWVAVSVKLGVLTAVACWKGGD